MYAEDEQAPPMVCAALENLDAFAGYARCLDQGPRRSTGLGELGEWLDD